MNKYQKHISSEAKVYRKVFICMGIKPNSFIFCKRLVRKYDDIIVAMNNQMKYFDYSINMEYLYMILLLYCTMKGKNTNINKITYHYNVIHKSLEKYIIKEDSFIRELGGNSNRYGD